MGLRDTISRLLLLLALFFAPAIGAGQIGASPEKHTIGGEVVNSIDGQPIAGALVELGGERAMLTDREGRFEFRDVAGYDGGALATKPGYFPAAPLFFVNPGTGVQETHAVTLKLIPEAIVFGKVLDQYGQPLQGLQVQLKMLQTRDGLRRWQQMLATQTNVEGEFRFAELQAGKYSLATGFLIDGSPEAASALGFAPVIYPPLSGDQGLSLMAGDHSEANLNVPSQRLYAVTGRIEGARAQGVTFEAETSSGGMISPVVRFNPFSSEFRLSLPSGSYRLKLHAFVERGQLFAAREISIGEAPLKNILITLAPLATLPVELEYQASNASTQETDRAQPFFANVGLEEADPSGLGRTYPAQPSRPSNSPSNSLVIRDLEPGQYRLVAQPQPPWYLGSAVCGGLDLRRELMSIAGSAAGCSLHAVLRNDSATLHWSVHSRSQGGGVKQVYVIALPLDNFIQSISMVGAQQAEGEVVEGSMAGLAPGRYLVIALDHPEELPYREPEVLQQYLSLGKEATVTAQGKSDVQLDLVSGEP